MADSYTTRNRLRLIETGSRPNTWGVILNSDALGLGDVALDGWTTKVLSGNVTLTSSNGATDEARARVLKFTGTGAYQVTIPSSEKWYIVDNQLTGTLTVTTGSGTSATLDTTESAVIFCDGTNVKSIGVGSQSLKDYIDAVVLPSMTGQSGKILTNNGTVASWTDAVPQSAKALCWASVSTAGALNYGFNAASATKTGTGVYRVTMTAAAGSTSYVVMAAPTAGAQWMVPSIVSTTVFQINVFNTGGAVDGSFYASVFGT